MAAKDGTRIYRYSDTKAPGKDRLIRTTSQAASTAFAVRDRDSSRIATQDDLEELLPAGVKVEDGSARAGE